MFGFGSSLAISSLISCWAPVWERWPYSQKGRGLAEALKSKALESRGVRLVFWMILYFAMKVFCSLWWLFMIHVTNFEGLAIKSVCKVIGGPCMTLIAEGKTVGLNAFPNEKLLSSQNQSYGLCVPSFCGLTMTSNGSWSVLECFFFHCLIYGIAGCIEIFFRCFNGLQWFATTLYFGFF